MSLKATLRPGSSFFCLSQFHSSVAQSTGGRILGRVADPSGAVLAGAKVTLSNEATGVSRDSQDQRRAATTFSSKSGPGNTASKFEQQGFKTNRPQECDS